MPHKNRGLTSFTVSTNRKMSREYISASTSLPRFNDCFSEAIFDRTSVSKPALVCGMELSIKQIYQAIR